MKAYINQPAVKVVRRWAEKHQVYYGISGEDVNRLLKISARKLRESVRDRAYLFVHSQFYESIGFNGLSRYNRNGVESTMDILLPQLQKEKGIDTIVSLSDPNQRADLAALLYRETFSAILREKPETFLYYLKKELPPWYATLFSKAKGFMAGRSQPVPRTA